MTHESILVVDDQPSTVRLIQAILSADEYNVRFASNATEALETIQNSRPDLILTDIHLPGMDGLALTKVIKSNADSRHIKIVAISAYELSEVDKQVIAAGCDGFITKPIDTRTILASIRAILDK